MLDINTFRDGMSMLASAVTVVTTGGARGRAGFTATAVTSVTDQPPTLLVCMNRSTYAHPILAHDASLCVNVLSADQQTLSPLFADRNVTMDERFDRVGSRTLETGSPALDGAVVSVDCRILKVLEFGSHSVFFCQVASMSKSGGQDALVYFDRGYHSVCEVEVLPG